MSIRRSGLAIAALMSGVIAVTCGIQLTERLSAYRNAAAAHDQETRLAAGFAAVGNLAVERGPVSRALVGKAPADAAVLTEFEANRRASDAALERLGVLARDDAELAQRVSAVRSKIGVAREQSSVNWQKPQADRPDGIAVKITRDYSEATASLNKFLETGIKATMRLSPAAGGLLDVAQKGWAARQISGQIGLMLTGLVSAGRPATLAERDELSGATGQITRLWSQIVDRGGDASAPAGTRASVAAAQDVYFGSNKALRDSLIKSAFTGAPYDMSVDVWRKASTAAVASLMGVRDAAVADAQSVAERDEADALRGILGTGAAILATLGLAAASTVLLVRHLLTPITTLSAVMNRLARNEEAEVPYAGLRNEIGGMASAVQVFKEAMLTTKRLAVEQAAQRVVQETRAAQLEQLVRAFETKAGDAVRLLACGATDLEATAQTMSSTATRTKRQATTVTASAEEASAGAQTVAAAAEQLTASISEISRQVSHSHSITDQAVSDAKRTNVIVQALSDGAEKIGHVVGLISDIAGQTNLLALNATIEAARAGDAGKGFAVVASEVKSLAQQTAKATQEIGAQIGDIQAATKEAVDAIRAIAGTISEVSAIATSIAAAVEQQGAATAEIARNVQQTAHAAQTVTITIGGVSEAANDTGTAAGDVLGAATGLSRQSEQLAAEVNRFVAGVRAA